MLLSERLALHRLFKDSLVEAQSQRKMRDDWVDFERQTMLDEVNKEMAKRHLPPASTLDITKAESKAEGHVDYTSKFALYCAFVVEVAQTVRDIEIERKGMDVEEKTR